MSFKGFDVPNGHTQIPNDFIELVLQSGVRKDPRNPDKPILSIGEIKIMLFMFRETFGWQRAGSSLEFSFNDLTVATFTGKATVNAALKSLLEKEYIQRAEIDGKYRYRLNLTEYQDYPWQLSRDWKKTFKIEEKKTRRFANRTKGSSLTEPEAVRYPNQGEFANRTTKNPASIEPVESKTSLKKGLNKDLNKVLNINTYLPEIETSQLPDSIKAILKDKVGRLVSDNIKLYEIENNFFSNEANINTFKYAETLSYCLGSTREPITSFSSIMNIYIANRIKRDSEASEKVKERVNKPIRTEKVFEYMDNTETQEETIDLEELRKEIDNRNNK